MTPDQLAEIHAAAFVQDRSWSAAEFAALLDGPHVYLFKHPNGFALTRTIAGESELLTLAVDPAFQRRGIAHALLTQWLGSPAAPAQTAFLEVAADNSGARALYARLGFGEVARRAGYYTRKNAQSVDALILRRDITFG